MSTKTKSTIFAVTIATLAIAPYAYGQIAPSIAPTKKHLFPNSHDQKPPSYKGQAFELSQDFPKVLPKPEVYPWADIDFKTNWKSYMTTVLDYCFDGNIHDGDVANDFDTKTNKKRSWYHAPWLHWGPSGREYIHGLTSERVSRKYALAKTQTSIFQNWAVSFYNPPGGYTLGQFWKDPEQPNTKAAMFPEGTVAYKLLFTEATPDQVPYLEGSPVWQANIAKPRDDEHPIDAKREIKPMRLLQVDIAVKDLRAETGWVYGTFIYNSKAPGSSWRKLTPVGLSWGSDPTFTSKDLAAGKKPQESILNTDPDLPEQHFGLNGRLNGPVDNPKSSCLSCHQTSEHPGSRNTAMMPLEKLTFWNKEKKTKIETTVLPDSPELLRWFRNLKPGEAFDDNRTSLDTSLQLQVGLQNFYQWKAIKENRGGYTNTWTTEAPTNQNLTGYKATRDDELIPLSSTEMQ